MSTNIQDIQSLAQRAVNCDSGGNFSAAIYYYRETCKIIFECPEVDFETRRRGKLYSERADELESILLDKSHLFSTVNDKICRRAGFYLQEALSHDESGKSSEAIQLYMEAIDLCLTARNSEPENSEIKDKLADIARQALERAENLKEKTHCEKRSQKTESLPDLDKMNLSESHFTDNTTTKYYEDDEDDTHQRTKCQEKRRNEDKNLGYSEEEKKILALTSVINSIQFLPYLSVDSKERFAYPIPFSDPHGMLKLSPKQIKKFSHWIRGSELMSNPTILQKIDCFSVRQTIVSDCSFVASIAVGAQYEKKFSRKLISCLIYPQNKWGEPIFNPCGKYMVKLKFNGVSRKVIIDDYLPLGHHGELLCSYSSNSNELWVSLLEKAYLKVMGGYDFPGSNSNIDLYALTGWIPERIPISKNTDKNYLFKKIYERFHQGDVLMTVATGPLSKSSAERSGLVSTHAYAVLDCVEIQGLSLFLLKNPWSHCRWKGNYSELDTQNWTPSLQKKLNYNPRVDASFDNGVFWIDINSLFEFFDVLYLNWRPEIFNYSTNLLTSWNVSSGPVKDSLSLYRNPQFILEMTDSLKQVSLWILLSRHITNIEDFSENKEYISLSLYDLKGRHRVLYPSEPPPLTESQKINSPHSVISTVVSSPSKLTLVLSQFEKTTTLIFSLSVYSSAPFNFFSNNDTNSYFKQVVEGEWKGHSAGGSSHYSNSFFNNPIINLILKEPLSSLYIEIKAPRGHFIGIDVFSGGDKDVASLGSLRKSSGPYRPGLLILFVTLEKGSYILIPSLFKPGQESPFILTVESSGKFTLTKN